LAQERARNQQLQRELQRLQHEFEQFRVDCGDPASLRRLIASLSLQEQGIRARTLKRDSTSDPKGSLSVNEGTSYRSTNRVAVAVWLWNSSDAPWLAFDASLVNARDEALTGVRFWQRNGPIPPHESGLVVVEVEATPDQPLTEVTLRLREDGPRSISIPRVVFPP
jgi:uncharacterized protein (TIGR02268 family)